MPVAFAQLLPAFNGSAPATSDEFTPLAAGNTGVYFDLTGDGTDQNLAMTGIGLWPSQFQFNASTNATLAMQANIAMAASAQTVTLTDDVVGFVAAYTPGVEYSGVAALGGASITEVDAPGTGPGAITGPLVVVPPGGLLVAMCLDPINSETISGTGTARSSSVFNPSYLIQDYAGDGSAVQSVFTTSANGGAKYFVHQIVLSAPMAASLKYVSSPIAITLQSYYSAASTGFTTYAAKGDGTQPPGTGFRQSLSLAAGAQNVVDVNACTWLATCLAAYSGDPLLSQIAINSTVFPPSSAQPIPVIEG
jgi:hypothetical protein